MPLGSCWNPRLASVYLNLISSLFELIVVFQYELIFSIFNTKSNVIHMGAWLCFHSRCQSIKRGQRLQ